MILEHDIINFKNKKTKKTIVLNKNDSKQKSENTQIQVK